MRCTDYASATRMVTARKLDRHRLGGLEIRHGRPRSRPRSPWSSRREDTNHPASPTSSRLGARPPELSRRTRVVDRCTDVDPAAVKPWGFQGAPRPAFDRASPAPASCPSVGKP